eukprot:scpid50427/ scgid3133/ Histone-lysine N-methyltransferase ASH1L; ASH1-like protein; Absent small and homeotic disks protein 1 homolog
MEDAILDTTADDVIPIASAPDDITMHTDMTNDDIAARTDMTNDDFTPSDHKPPQEQQQVKRRRDRQQQDDDGRPRKSFRYCGLYHNCMVVGGKRRRCEEPTDVVDVDNTDHSAKRSKPQHQQQTPPGQQQQETPPGQQQQSLFPPPYAQGELWLLKKKTDFRLPYDIWWQHENGKLKPKPVIASKFKKIRTNDYSSLESAPSQSKDHPVCGCQLPTDISQPGCGDDCLNRLVFTECLPGQCACGERCSNQRFQKRQWTPHIQRFLTDHCGFGIRSTAPIAKDEFVIEYVGEVITEPMLRDRQETLYSSSCNHYCLSLHSGLVIDSTACGSEARFVNHSCQPNCEMQCWTVAGQYRMGLFTLQDIPSGGELTYDYRFDSLDNEAQTCRCGADSCRGFLCPPRKAQALHTLMEEECERKKRRRKKGVSSSSGLTCDLPHPVPIFGKSEPLRILNKREEVLCVRQRIFLVRNAMRSPLWKKLVSDLSKTPGTATAASSVSTSATDNAQSSIAQESTRKGVFRKCLVSLLNGRFTNSRWSSAQGDNPLSFLRQLHLARLLHGTLKNLTLFAERSDNDGWCDVLRPPSRRKHPEYYTGLAAAANDAAT